MKFHNSITQTYGRDEKLEKEGVNLVIQIDSQRSITFRIARAGGSNDRFHASFAKRMAGISTPVIFDNLPPDQRRKIWQEVYLDSVILGWEGVLDDQENPVPFTRENVLDFFEQYAEIWELVWSHSREFSNFKEKVDAVVKNWPRTSSIK
jgi:hypothetical protein